MIRALPFVTLWAAFLVLVPGAAAAATPREADPLIGTGRGATFAGAAVPFGFAAPGPDTVPASGSGYRPGGRALGFSQTHVSGVGGGGSTYGNFRLTPVAGPLQLTDLSSPLSRERAAPGSYAAHLARYGIGVELTATRLGALHRYRFPRRGPWRVVLEVTSSVPVAGAPQPLSSMVRLPGSRRLEGRTTMRGGWNGARFTLFFALRLDQPLAGVRVVRGPGRRTRVVMSFRPGRRRTLQAGVGLSFRGVRRARRSVPALSFDRVRRRARRAWSRALGAISVRGGTRSQRRTFASALYRSQLMPHDLTGENAWWRSRRPHYEDFFALWDTFRTLHPLLAVIQPRRQAAMVQSLVETFRHTGWIPDARVAGSNGITQVGSSGAALVADALAKGLRGIDYRTAYRALVKDAEVNSPRPLRAGRELSDYLRLGYLSTRQGRSASRTLEYAFADFALSRVAARVGRHGAARRYRRRSLSWARLWDPSTRSIRPRRPDGSFASPFSPTLVHTGFEAPFFEGSARQWSTFVPHDVRGLIRRLGGDGPFVAWLDELFSRGLFEPGNEHDLLAPWLYAHAGRPDRTATVVRRLLALYRPTRDGLPGEDDAGALSSWFVWSAIGLYPNAGQPFYYVGSPLFRRARIRLGRRRALMIEARGGGHGRNYVRSARLRGRPLRRAWITHRELRRGGRLVLRMGRRPSAWGRARRPPSL